MHDTNKPAPPAPRFAIGHRGATPGAYNVLKRLAIDADDLFARHASGDWGRLCEEDKEQNEAALVSGTRLMSAYRASDGTELWIITDADRSSTTILLPEEY